MEESAQVNTCNTVTPSLPVEGDEESPVCMKRTREDEYTYRWEECPVCSCLFDEASRVPICMPCNHTICRMCATTLFPTADGGRCPICREEVLTSAAALRPNYQLRGLLLEWKSRSYSQFGPPVVTPGTDETPVVARPPTTSTLSLECAPSVSMEIEFEPPGGSSCYPAHTPMEYSHTRPKRDGTLEHHDRGELFCTAHKLPAICFCKECFYLVCVDCMMTCIHSHGKQLIRIDDTVEIESFLNATLAPVKRRVNLLKNSLSQIIRELENSMQRNGAGIVRWMHLKSLQDFICSTRSSSTHASSQSKRLYAHQRRDMPTLPKASGSATPVVPPEFFPLSCEEQCVLIIENIESWSLRASSNQDVIDIASLLIYTKSTRKPLLTDALEARRPIWHLRYTFQLMCNGCGEWWPSVAHRQCTSEVACEWWIAALASLCVACKFQTRERKGILKDAFCTDRTREAITKMIPRLQSEQGCQCLFTTLLTLLSFSSKVFDNSEILSSMIKLWTVCKEVAMNSALHKMYLRCLLEILRNQTDTSLQPNLQNLIQHITSFSEALPLGTLFQCLSLLTRFAKTYPDLFLTPDMRGLFLTCTPRNVTIKDTKYMACALYELTLERAHLVQLFPCALDLLEMLSGFVLKSSADGERLPTTDYVEWFARVVANMARYELVRQGDVHCVSVLRDILIRLCHYSGTMEDVQWVSNAIANVFQHSIDVAKLFASVELLESYTKYVVPQWQFQTLEGVCADAVAKAVFVIANTYLPTMLPFHLMQFTYLLQHITSPEIAIMVLMALHSCVTGKPHFWRSNVENCGERAIIKELHNLKDKWSEPTLHTTTDELLAILEPQAHP